MATAFAFPSSPSQDEIIMGPLGAYQWNGVKWIVLGSEDGGTWGDIDGGLY